MKNRFHFTEVPIMVLILIILVMITCKCYQEVRIKKVEAELLKHALAGFYWVIGEDNEHKISLLKNYGSSKQLQNFADYDTKSLVAMNPEEYTVYEISLKLENNSEIDLNQVVVLSHIDEVYIENGFLVCDAPILPAGYNDLSHDRCWVIFQNDVIKGDDVDFELFFRAVTEHGYSVVCEISKILHEE